MGGETGKSFEAAGMVFIANDAHLPEVMMKIQST